MSFADLTGTRLCPVLPFSSRPTEIAQNGRNVATRLRRDTIALPADLTVPLHEVGDGHSRNPITWRCSTMLSRGWRMGALAVGAMIACGGTAFAGDDVKTLKLTASSVIG